MSKDFGCNGLHLGLLLTQSNEALIRSARSGGVFAWPCSISEFYWTTFLNDRQYLDYYLSENKRRLAEGFETVTSFLRSYGIEWLEGTNAGFFIWADFRPILGSEIVVNDEGPPVDADAVGIPSQIHRTNAQAQAKDEWFFNKLTKGGLFLATGDSFFSELHGFYRITFTLPKPLLELGLERLRKVLEEIRT